MPQVFNVRLQTRQGYREVPVEAESYEAAAAIITGVESQVEVLPELKEEAPAAPAKSEKTV